MTALNRNTDSRPVVAWIGRPLPAASQRRLAGIVEISDGWRSGAALVGVWATDGLDVLRGLPKEAAGAPVIAASEHEPSPDEKRIWLQAGVEDVVSLSSLPGSIAARLRQMSGGSSDHGPRSQASPGGQAAGAVGVRSSAGPAARDDFPPLLVPRPADGVPDEVRTWVDQLGPYLELRDSLLGGWTNGVLERFLELSHRRAMVAPRIDGAPAPDTLGDVHGSRSLPVSWTALIRRGPARGRSGIEVAEARIVGAGTDGITLAVPFAANPRQKLVMDVAVDADTNAQLLLQARWQRRTGTERWLLGVLVLEMRLREVPSITA
jgi:hypothetical protein